MIQAMLQNFLQYKNLDSMPNNKKYNLIKLNNELLSEINKIRVRLDYEQYKMASIEYKKIIKNIDISFLRRLMFEFKINFKTENNTLIDFSIDNDNINLEQNILLYRLINHNKMRNIIKFLILKKYSKLKINEDDKIKVATENLINEVSKVSMNDEFSKLALESVLNYMLKRISKSGQKGGGNLEYDNILMVCVGLYFNDINKKIYDLCCDIIRFKNNKNEAEQIISRMEALLRDSYPYKVLLSQAVVKDNVDFYKNFYREQLGDKNSDIIKTFNMVTLDMLTLFMPILENDSELCEPKNTFYMILPIYLTKARQKKVVPLDEEVIQKLISPLVQNEELQFKLNNVFSKKENTSHLESVGAFLLVNNDDNSKNKELEEIKLQEEIELQKIELQKIDLQKKQLEESKKLSESKSVTTKDTTINKEEQNVEEESWSYILEKLDYTNWEYDEDYAKIILQERNKSDEQPDYLNAKIKERATLFNYKIGSTQLGTVNVIPLKNKEGKFQIYNKNLDGYYSSFFLPNGIEIMFFDDSEKINNYLEDNNIVYSFLGMTFKTYNEANAFRLYSNENIDFMVFDRIFTGYINKKKDSSVSIKESEIDELKSRVIEYALENGYKENNKRWGHIEIEPIPYNNGRLGFKFIKNGIIVLYCDNNKTIFISPHNKNEFQSYYEAYHAYESKQYTGFKNIIQKTKNFSNIIIKKFKKISDGISTVYSFILKFTGGLLINSAGKIRAIIMIPSTINNKKKLLFVVANIAVAYYAPESYVKFWEMIISTGWNLGVFLLNLGNYLFQNVFSLGNYLYENVSSLTGNIIDLMKENVPDKTSIFINYLGENTLNLTSKLYDISFILKDNFNNYTIPLQDTYSVFESPFAIGGTYKKKYFKYKQKYIQLK